MDPEIKLLVLSRAARRHGGWEESCHLLLAVQPSPAQQQSHMVRCSTSSLIGNGLITAEPAVLPSHVGASPRRAVLTEGAVDELHKAGCTLCHIPGPRGIDG